jgi:predicted permease
MGALTGASVDLATKLLKIQVIASLVTFAGVGAICRFVLGLDPLWSGIIAMFSTFGTITAIWKIGK